MQLSYLNRILKCYILEPHQADDLKKYNTKQILKDDILTCCFSESALFYVIFCSVIEESWVGYSSATGKEVGFLWFPSGVFLIKGNQEHTQRPA